MNVATAFPDLDGILDRSSIIPSQYCIQNYILPPGDANELLRRINAAIAAPRVEPGCLMVMGAHVQYCGHAGWFVADIWRISGAAVVIAGGPIYPETLNRGQMETVTHHVIDFPTAGYWRPERGILVVHAAQCRDVAAGVQ